MTNNISVRRLLLNRWSLQLAATVGLLAFAAGRVDVGASFKAIGDANYAWAGAALTLLTASKLLAAVRWRLYLSSVGNPPLLGLMGAYVVGTMVNTILPFRAGDFTKIQLVASRYSLPRAALSSSVFTVEAVLDALTLLMLFLISLVLVDVALLPDLLVLTFIAVAGGGFVAAVLTSRFMPHEMPSWRVFGRLSPSARQVLASAWPKFLDGMVTLRDRHLFTRALALHVIEWLMRAGVLLVLGYGFDLGEEPPTYLLLTIVLAVGTLFPVTFLNLGTFQVIATEVLTASGIPREEAFAFAVTAYALTHGWILVMGVVALVLMQIGPGGLTRPRLTQEA